MKKFRLFVSCLLYKVTMAKRGDSSLQFPEDFLFGVASSAYQIEGGHNIDGKGENIYDFYTHKTPEKFDNRSNGDAACESYTKWQKDIRLVKELGVNFYRFSISFTRILPNGYSNKVNKAGVKYYQDLINELIKNGIEPMVTMYHWDLPMALQEMGGWTNIHTADYFVDYAKVLFELFGDKVKYWISINTALTGYGDSDFPPYINQPGRANYLCTYVMLVAHAKAYRLYETEFKNQQNGQIGLAIDARWFQPGSSSPEDVEAAKRVLEFEDGMWLNPILSPKGDFPQIVKERVENISKIEGYSRSRLPKLSPEEIDLLKGSCDFIGLNLYTTFLVKHVDDKHFTTTSMERDEGAKMYQDDSWQAAKSCWLKVYPEGARKILKWIKEKYNNPQIFITENGFSDIGQLNDTGRIEYLQKYLKAVLQAIQEDNVDIKGYAVWSLLDNFEWMCGYSEKFGLYHVDFNDPERKRTAKQSALWYRDVVKRRSLVESESKHN